MKKTTTIVLFLSLIFQYQSIPYAIEPNFEYCLRNVLLSSNPDGQKRFTTRQSWLWGHCRNITLQILSFIASPDEKELILSRLRDLEEIIEIENISLGSYKKRITFSRELIKSKGIKNTSISQLKELLNEIKSSIDEYFAWYAETKREDNRRSFLAMRYTNDSVNSSL